MCVFSMYSASMGTIYAENKDEDGFLYVAYSGEKHIRTLIFIHSQHLCLLLEISVGLCILCLCCILKITVQ